MDKIAKIVLCGCTGMGEEIITDMLAQQLPIDYIVTISPEKAVSQHVSGYCDLREIAAAHGIPCYVAEKYSLKSEKDIRFFREQEFDILVQGGWQRLFPDEVLQSLKTGAIGVHGSSDFLPKGRGRSPINWSLIEGKKRFIFHYFIMKAGVDDGDVFHYEIVDINEWDDCNTLYYKNSIVTANVLKRWIPRLQTGDFPVFKQEGEPTYYPRRTEEDGLIDWNKPVFEIYNFVRALTRPYPGAFSFIGDTKIRIWAAQPFDTKIAFFESPAGNVVKVFGNGDFIVNCNSGLLLVTDYDFSGTISANKQLN